MPAVQRESTMQRFETKVEGRRLRESGLDTPFA
jgi:hypothetical protein